MYILSFDRNFCEGIKGIMDSGRRQMTALAKLTETVEHAYKKRTETENKYLECLPEIGPCNMRQDSTFTFKTKKQTLQFCLVLLANTKST